MIALAGVNLSAGDISTLLLSLGVLLGLAKLLGELARRWRQPAVVGEILAGVMLGPTVLGALRPDWYAQTFPAAGAVPVALEGFTTLAVLLLLLVAGIEVDLSAVWRQGRAALAVSLSGVVFPFGIGFVVALLMPRLLGMSDTGDPLPFALFIGIALSITALPVITKMLMDLNILKSDIGSLILCAAMVDDLLGWIGFALVLALIHPDATAHGFLGTVGLTAIFIAFMLTLGRFTVHRLLPAVQAHLSWPGGVLGLILVVALFCGALTEWIGIHAIFGAFLAGVAVGDSAHLRQHTKDLIRQFVTHVFAPVFFASIGLRLNFVEAFNLPLVAFVVFLAVVVKVGGCFFGARWSGMPVRESLAVGFAMSARGAMEVILAQLARQAGLINNDLFVAIVVMAVFTSVAAGPAIERLLQRKKPKRLSDVLTEPQFVPNLRAVDARSALEELSAVAARVADLPYAQVFDALWQRERIMHTGLGQGLAVPHARLPQLKRPLVLVGRSERGIDFDAPDGSPARLVFVLLTPQGSQSEQLELLAAIARTFGNPRVHGEALDAGNFTQFRAALNIAESSQLGE